MLRTMATCTEAGNGSLLGAKVAFDGGYVMQDPVGRDVIPNKYSRGVQAWGD
jgi:hypothetical protein